MRLILTTALLAFAIVYGWRRGGGPERCVAAILAAMFITDRVSHLLLGDSGTAISRRHAVIDGSGALAMIGVMVAARRLWPIWVSSLQILSAVGHSARAVDADLPEKAVRLLITPPFVLICLSLIVATVVHRQRLRAHGADRSWRRERPASPNGI